MDLVIPINEGEKYTVAGVGFGKMTVFKPEELYPALTLNGNDAYSSKKMRDDITMIRSYYGSRGYADATVDSGHPRRRPEPGEHHLPHHRRLPLPRRPREHRRQHQDQGQGDPP